MTTIPNREEILANTKTLADSSKALAHAIPELSDRINSVEKQLDALRNISQTNHEAISEKIQEKTIEVLNQYSHLKIQYETEYASTSESLESLKVAVRSIEEKIGLIFPSMQANSESFRRSTEAYANSAELIQQHIKSLVTIDAAKVLLSEMQKDLAGKQDLQIIKTDMESKIEELKDNQKKETALLIYTIIGGALATVIAIVWGIFQISPPSLQNEPNQVPESQSPLVPQKSDS